MKSLKAISWKIKDDDLLDVVATFGALETLSLATQDVTDAGIAKITRMDSLRSVYLSDTGITAYGIKRLEAMPNLETIDIDFGIRINDRAMKILNGSTKIRYLRLGNSNRAPNLITDAGLESVGGAVNLEYLSIGDVPISDAGLKHVLKLKKLRRLHLDNTLITDAALGDLSELTSLESLHVDACKNITDAGLLRLVKHPGLKTVFVSPSYGISKAGIQELRNARPELKVYDGTFGF